MTVHDTWFGNLLGTYETEDECPATENPPRPPAPAWNAR